MRPSPVQPPELLRGMQLQGEGYDGSQTDVWACGICLYFMLV